MIITRVHSVSVRARTAEAAAALLDAPDGDAALLHCRYAPRLAEG